MNMKNVKFVYKDDYILVKCNLYKYNVIDIIIAIIITSYILTTSTCFNIITYILQFYKYYIV